MTEPKNSYDEKYSSTKYKRYEVQNEETGYLCTCKNFRKRMASKKALLTNSNKQGLCSDLKMQQLSFERREEAGGGEIF